MPHQASLPMTMKTRNIKPNVIQKPTTCPSDRAEADTVPLTSPITRAGQHHCRGGGAEEEE